MEINMIYYNTRGLNNLQKVDRLADDLGNLKPDVLALSETHLTRDLWLSGYKITQTAKNRKGGCLLATNNMRGGRSRPWGHISTRPVSHSKMCPFTSSTAT